MRVTLISWHESGLGPSETTTATWVAKLMSGVLQKDGRKAHQSVRLSIRSVVGGSSPAYRDRMCSNGRAISPPHGYPLNRSTPSLSVPSEASTPLMPPLKK